MKILTIYKILPAFVIYKPIDFPFVGKANGMIITIDPEYKNDKGLLEHELVHVKQFYKFPFHGFLYKFNKSYRLKCEIEAYKKQLEYNPLNLDLYASFITIRYGLEVDIKIRKRRLIV